MARKDIDVTGMGELLVDFISNGQSEQGHPLYEASPGGAPCNVLAMLARLGKRTAFIGKLGADALGTQLRQAAERVGIDTSAVLTDPHHGTTLAFVSKLPNGDRDFAFYREQSADVNLTAREVPEQLIARSRIFHFGSLSLTAQPVRDATLRCLELAERHGCLRSFDPNLRKPLWSSEELARQQIDWGLQHSDIVKISDDEARWFVGDDDLEACAQALRQRYPITLLELSMGAEGSRAYLGDIRVEEPAFVQSETVDTTGAGDTFAGCMLAGVLDHGLDSLDADALSQMLRFANAAASIVTTRKGALESMPTRAEVEELLAR